jgi:hypothetical protein
MTRQPPASLLPARSASSAKPGAGRPQLGPWLTHELRVKGAPLVARVGAASELSSAEAQGSGSARTEQVAFARWLTTDLRPRRPVTAIVEPSAPGSAPSEQALTLGVLAELDADDLAVLPVRRGALARIGNAPRRLALALVVLSCVGLVLFRRGAVAPALDARADAPAQASGVLPAAAELSEPTSNAQLQILPSPELTRRQAADAPRSREAAEPRSARSGPSTARFPDLPPPTLSRLTRDGAEQAREQEGLQRAGAKRPATKLAAQ